MKTVNLFSQIITFVLVVIIVTLAPAASQASIMVSPVSADYHSGHVEHIASGPVMLGPDSDVLMQSTNYDNVLREYNKQNQEALGGNPQSLPCIVGLVVLAGGIYVTYQLVKFCKAHFPPPPGTNDPPTTNSPPSTNSNANSFSRKLSDFNPMGLGNPADTNVYAAYIPLPMGIVNQIMPPGVSLDSLVPWTISITQTATNTILLSRPQVPSDTNQYDQSSYLSALNIRFGLIVPNPNQAAYSKNGIPTTNSPISYSNGVVMLNNNPLFTNATPVIVWRSYDNMKTWTPVCTNLSIIGMTTTFTDYEPSNVTSVLFRTSKPMQ